MLCLIDLTVDLRVSIHTVCGILLYLNIRSLVLNLLLIVAFAIFCFCSVQELNYIRPRITHGVLI